MQLIDKYNALLKLQEAARLAISPIKKADIAMQASDLAIIIIGDLVQIEINRQNRGGNG